MAVLPQPASVHGNRAWCFTLNNPTDEENLLFPNALPNETFRYAVSLVYQLEAGEGNTPHYQGYVRFNRQRTLAHVRAILARAHWEPAKGTAQQNVDYCCKDAGRLSEPVLLGFGPIRPGGGGLRPQRLRRADIVELLQETPDLTVTELINRGGLEIIATQPNLVGCLKGHLLQDNRRAGVVCHLYYGLTGCGKSRLATTLFPAAYRKGSGDWWDSYNGESEVILDDFDDDFMHIGDLLRVVDRYPMRVPVKGSFVQLVATTFIITSNHLPHEWYPKLESKRVDAVRRRIATVVTFNSDGRTMSTHQASDYFDTTSIMPVRPVVELLPWLRPAEVDVAPVAPVVVDPPGEPFAPVVGSPLLFPEDDEVSSVGSVDFTDYIYETLPVNE